jgi:putative oxidoreductase
VIALTIQIFVYPDACATHGVRATVPPHLIAKGPGRISLDHFLARRLPCAR